MSRYAGNKDSNSTNTCNRVWSKTSNVKVQLSVLTWIILHVAYSHMQHPSPDASQKIASEIFLCLMFGNNMTQEDAGNEYIGLK